MNLDQALDGVLSAYKTYYNINRTSPAAPFAAEAEFHLHDEQYFLIRSARISEVDSREHVFFATYPVLDLSAAEKLAETAWQTGLERVRPHANHRNTDVTLIVLTEELTDDAAAFVKTAKRYKSYRFGLRGWSQFRMLVYDLHSGRLVHNRLGENLKGIINNNKFFKKEG